MAASAECRSCKHWTLDPRLGYNTITLADLRDTASGGCPLCGMVLEAITSNCSCTGDEAAEPASEVEIILSIKPLDDYKSKKMRLVVSSDLLGPGLEFYTTDRDIAQRWSLLELGSHVSADSSSSECFEKAKRWIDACTGQHGNRNCPSSVGSVLPTRVIDVGDSSTNPRLYEPAFESKLGERGVWTSLSYCWGPETSMRFKTTKKSLGDMRKGFKLEQMPKTCRDAVIAARNLNIKYIWIDALCIVQDDCIDWERESARMCNVYENAIVTFAAADSLTSDSGLFRSSAHREYRKMKIKFPDGKFGEVFTRAPYDTEAANFVHSPLDQTYDHLTEGLNKRAWTFQETLISPRVLWFTVNELLWSCRTDVTCECTPYFANLHPQAESRWFENTDPYKLDLRKRLSFRQDTDWIEEWNGIVVEFTQRAISYSTDRLPALTGIATILQNHIGSAYYAGMWNINLSRQLLFGASNIYLGTLGPYAPTDYIPEGYAPSWSWSSLDSRARVEYIYDHYFNRKKYECSWTLNILETVFTPSGVNQYGSGYGKLKIESKIIPLAPMDSKVDDGLDVDLLLPTNPDHRIFNISTALDPRDGEWKDSDVISRNHGFAFLSTHVFKKKPRGGIICMGLILAAATDSTSLKRIGVGQIILREERWKMWEGIREEKVYLV